VTTAPQPTAAAPSESAGSGSTDLGPIGGQALIDGVMMRRGERWGAAVRHPDGTITTTSRALPAGLAPWRKVPVVRGVLALGESTGLGTKAMLWAAGERSDPDEGDGFSKVGLVASTVIAVVLALGLFGLMPAAVAKALGLEGRVMFNVVEGLIRLGVLVGYLLLLGRSAEVRRVFAYHGAEHMTIHAFEHRVPLEPAAIRAFDRRHPRCGTSFLLLVVLVTVAAHMVIGTPSWGLLVASRILGLPVVAGLSYEVIRFAGRHQETPYGRALMLPGYWLQGITTQEPDDDQIEVAVAALQATVLGADPSAAPIAVPVPAVGA
jgi:uncharacterized protein YqhQ